MNDMLACCKITDKSENIELLPELLSAMDLDFSTWANPEGSVATHTVYCASSEEAESVRERMEELADTEWREMGISVAEVATFSIKREDWAEFWKQHFKVLNISERLVIRPSWEQVPDKPGQAVIVLDPGMSFGTGHHPTTSFCLRMIDELASSGTRGSFLDAGCGSGILSIAAQKLGFAPVEAFDIDPDAVKVAVENFEKNGCLGDIRISTSGLDEFQSAGQRDVIAANILSSILIGSRDKILSMLKSGGSLILAGILREEYGRVRDAFAEAGCREVKNFSENEWTSGLLVKN